MSGILPTDSESGVSASDWNIRPARPGDVGEIAAGVAELLIELGATPAATNALERAARTLIDDREAGALLVADHEGHTVGLLGASWQFAMRVQSRYGLIQELWVHPAWRGQAIGEDLLVALYELARERDMKRLEVGLPSPHFRNLGATEAFYVNNGFEPIGTRMRRLL
ncbi:MAG: GNAT family N-acetyltransferase [Solirubrobacteraceae bacterium]